MPEAYEILGAMMMWGAYLLPGLVVGSLLIMVVKIIIFGQPEPPKNMHKYRRGR